MKKKHTKELTTEQKELFVKHYPLVRRIVAALKYRLPSHLDFDELHSMGVQGLADAVSRIDETKRLTHLSYIYLRVKGTILDELRDMDYMSRSARTEAKIIAKKKDELKNKLGRDPEDHELRDALGVTQEKFQKINRRTQNLSFFSLNDSNTENEKYSELIPDERIITAAKEMENKEMKNVIRKNVKHLPEKQRKVIQSHYFDEKKFAEIAKDFGLTEARISQIHSLAIKNLRAIPLN